MADKRVRGRDLGVLGGVAIAALMACGASSTPYMDLPKQDQDMYDACRERAVDWCLETKFGSPKLLSNAESVTDAQENLRRAEARKAAVDEHFEECNGEFMEDGIARTEYVGKGTPAKRKEWLLSIGCSETTLAKAKDLPKE